MALKTPAEVNAYFRKVTANLRPLAERAMNAAMAETGDQLREFAPVDTGEYLAGIDPLFVPHENVIAGFEFQAPHSPIVHFFNYGGGTIQALRDAKDRVRNHLIDAAADLVRVS